MMQKLLLGLLLAGVTVVAAAETVYKWVDSRGQIYYTDLPPSQADARVLGVFHQTVGVVEEEAEDGDEAGGEGDAAAAAEPATLPAPSDTVASVRADVEKARSTQCKEAQERYQRYIESRRLFRQTPDGQRQYLSDQELTEARIKAKQAVDDYCG